MGVHFFYVVLILSLLIVGLITRNWTKLEGFTDYLSVAATVSSLVLGILAIIYSFVSSGSMSNFLGSIERANRDMTSVAHDLRNVLDQGQKIQNQAEGRTKQLHALTINLSSSLEQLAQTTQNIKKSVDQIPGQIDSIKERIPFSMENSPNHQRIHGLKTWSDSELELFLKISSGMGLVALRLALEANTADVYASMAGFYGDNFENYGYGFLMAADAAMIIDVNSQDGDSMLPDISASTNNENLYALLIKEWESRVEKDKLGEGEFLSDNLEKIQSAVRDGTARKGS